MGPEHESVADSVSTAKHKGLRLLIQATRRRHCLVAISFRVHEAVIDGIVVRKKLELFWIIREVVDLAAKQLWGSISFCNQSISHIILAVGR
jgi:hypothetical protein